MPVAKLSKCLTRFGKAFAPKEAELLHRIADEYVGDGLTGIEAAKAAVRDVLAIHQDNLESAKSALPVLGTPADIAQASFPREKRTAGIELADAMIESGIKTPHAMAEYLDEKFDKKARKFSDALWSLFRFSDPSLPQVSDWNAVYGAIDKPAAPADIAPRERTGPVEGNLDAGRGNPRPVEQPAESQPAGSGEPPASGIPAEGLEHGERARPEGQPAAGQPAIAGPGTSGRGRPGQGRSDVGAIEPAGEGKGVGSGEASGAGDRSGEGSTAVAGTEPAARPAGLAPEENHRIAAEDVLVPGGDKTKARANLSALKLLKQLEAEDRSPTPEEKKVLAQYVGWGGLPNIFNDGAARLRETQKQGRWMSDDQRTELANWEKDWGKSYDEAKNLLAPEERAAAARSTLNAHYTSREVISGMWDIARRLGFKGGTALETSAGIGHFLGLEPGDMADRTRWKAVELDSVSGRMLGKLYPKAQVQVTGFQDAKLPDHSVDLVIGNVPFAKDGPISDRYPRMSLHNFFFARAMDALKPGGVLVSITSSSTMDSPSSKEAREWLAERADLVGAIRLPNTAFKKNAGTEVTTDIVILRKRGGGAFSGGNNWINTQEIPTHKGDANVTVNEYFARHPEMMLGRMSLEGTMYRGDEPALLPNPGSNLTDELKAAAAKLPEGIIGNKSSVQPTQDAAPVGAEGEQAAGKEGSIVVKQGKPYQIEQGVLKAPAWAKTPAKAKQAGSYVKLRDQLKELLAFMQDPNASDAAIAAAREKLNELYDAHVAKYGAVSDRGHNYLEDDPELPLVQALEDLKTAIREVEVKSGKDAGKKRQVFEKRYEKATIFNKRTIFPRSEPTSADTMADAISQSLAYRNEIDPAYIAQLRGVSEADASNLLKAEPDLFVDPKTGKFEPSDAYLSGFVREKLNEAKKAAVGDPAYQKNVDALEKNQPAWLGMHEISFKLGSSWLPAPLVQKFLADKLRVGAIVHYVPQTGHWKLDPRSGYAGAANVTTYGTTRIAGHELVEDALNLKSPVIYDTVQTADGESKVKNQQETLIAQQKQQEIQTLFRDYVKGLQDAHPELEKIYNERFNGVKLREFNGPKWDHYPNASHEVALRTHQKDVVARILQESTLLAHSVGTGKTFIMITAAQEMRRLGMAKKPMIVTQNATTQQFAASYKKLYPTARILVPSEKQRQAQNRQRLMSQIATGDYDAIIIPQSFLNQLPDDPERLKSFIQQEIDDLEGARISIAHSEGKHSPKTKDLEKAKNRLEEKLKKLLDRKVDNTVTFEQLGVDALMVDEAHAYKKLEFATQMDNIKGLDRGASERGLGLYMKTRWIQEKNNGKNVVLATGTPVSNTIAEAWNMIRFTRPDLLQKYGVEKFDDFASTFGDTITNVEQTAGGGFKSVTRFARYTNGPELIALFHSAADVVLKEDINLPGLPAVKNGQPTTVKIGQTPNLKAFIRVLRDRLAAFERMTGQEKRQNSHIPLVVFGEAKKATLDMRLINPDLPEEAGNKIDRAAQEITRIYRESSDQKGAQLVFADLFQSPDGAFNLYHEIRKKLVAQGIPENEIAIIGEAKNPAQRERIFEAVKAGEIRVMLGSTEKMGVGVNVQDRLIALHHLDAPPRPMDIEQRNGRIVRQGNQNPVVELLNYGVENTLDATLYQRLAIKQKFINQIMRGDVEGRSFEDAADEVSMTFEEQMAAFSGNPLAMKRVAVEGEVRRLEALRQGFIRQSSATRGQLEAAKNDLKNKEAFQPKIDKAAGEMAAKVAGEATGEVDGKVYADRKTLVEALDKKLGDFVTKQKGEIGMQIESKGWQFPAGTVTLYGQPVQLVLHVPVNEHGIVGEGAREPYYTYESLLDGGVKLDGQISGGQGLMASFTAQAKGLTTRAADNTASIARINRDITEMTGFLTQPFAQEEELRKSREERDSIDKSLEAASKEESAKEEADRLAAKTESPDQFTITPEKESEPLGTPATPPTRPKNKNPILDEIQRLLAPQTRSADARVAADTMREHGAELAQRTDRAESYLKNVSKAMNGMKPDDRWAAVDAIETGAKQPKPDFQPFADLMRTILDDRRTQVQDLDKGALDKFIENYFPHIWKDPDKAATAFQEAEAKRPIEGSKAFLKKRTIPTIKEGMELGLEPVSSNPVDLVLLKVREMDKFILAHRTLDDLKSKGLVEYIPAGAGAPLGYKKIEDKIATIYGPRTGAVGLPEGANVGQKDVRVFGRRIMGEYYAPESVATVINNYLSPGLRGSPTFRGYLTMANSLNQFQLGLSAFHLGFTSMDAATSRLAVGLEDIAHGNLGDAAKAIGSVPISPLTTALNGNKVLKEWLTPGSQGEDIARIVDGLKAGGGRAKMDSFYQTTITKKMMENLRGAGIWSKAKGVAGIPFAGIEQASKPIMEWIVPRQKLGVFLDLARRDLEKLGPGATREEVRRAMAKAWDSVDNRLGQIVYDNLFWKKAAKDLSMASVRSLGWNLGTLRELGGGVVDALGQVKAAATGHKPEVTHRMAYLAAMPIIAGLVGAMIGYAFTGKGPDELKDYFFPKTGEKDAQGRDIRLNLPSYMRDLYHYAHDPVGTITGKVHPLISLVKDMLMNKDYFDRPIRNSDDPFIKQLLDTAEHALRQFTPIGVDQALQASNNNQRASEKVGAFLGVTRAPKWVSMTAAEQLAEKLNAAHLGSASAPKAGEQDRYALKNNLASLLRNGTPEEQSSAKSQVHQLVSAGELSRAESRHLLQATKHAYLTNAMTHLDANEAVRVFREATPQERAIIHGMVVGKIERSQLPNKDKSLLWQEFRRLSTGKDQPIYNPFAH